MSKLPMNCLRHGMRFSTNRDAAREVGIGERLERTEYALPAVLPVRDNLDARSGQIHKFRIPIPRGAFAVSTATTRDQPPESLAVSRTRAEPKVSTGAGSRPLVRVALAFPARELRPRNRTRRRRVRGRLLKPCAFPRQGSGAMVIGKWIGGIGG